MRPRGTQCSSQSKLPHPLHPLISPLAPRTAVIKIRADGYCLLRIAGEILGVLRDPALLDNRYAACLPTNLQSVRESAIKNFTSFLCEIKEDKTITDTEEHVRLFCGDTVQEIYARLEGRTKHDVYSTNMDLGLFSRHMNILFTVMCTKGVLHVPSYRAYTLVRG